MFQKDEGTLDDQRRDGGTNFILRIKEQKTHLTLQEHDDDDSYFIIIICFRLFTLAIFLRPTPPTFTRHVAACNCICCIK